MCLDKKNRVSKMSMLPKPICTFSAILTTTLMTYFTELVQVFQKGLWNHEALNSDSDLEKEQSWRNRATQCQTVL